MEEYGCLFTQFILPRHNGNNDNRPSGPPFYVFHFSIPYEKIFILIKGLNEVVKGVSVVDQKKSVKSSDESVGLHFISWILMDKPLVLYDQDERPKHRTDLEWQLLKPLQ